jgi:hypothetical protein
METLLTRNVTAIKKQSRKVTIVNKLTDFPKIECPFVRKNISIEKNEYAKLRKLGIRMSLDNSLYLVTPEINPGYEWVFTDEEVVAVEKLDGSNFKILIKNNRIEIIQNRANDPIDILSLKGAAHVGEAFMNSHSAGYIAGLGEGEHAGELIGPKVNGNKYQIDRHYWYPFKKTLESLKYNTFNKYPRTFDNFSEWFHLNLKSVYHAKANKIQIAESNVFAEGVVFYHIRRMHEGRIPYLAKLRRDMFDWYFREKGINF